jgi:hypothetical protein
MALRMTCKWCLIDGVAVRARSSKLESWEIGENREDSARKKGPRSTNRIQWASKCAVWAAKSVLLAFDRERLNVLRVPNP